MRYASLVLVAVPLAALVLGHAARAASPASASSAIPMQEVSPTLSLEPLVNPGMGLYLYGTLDPADMPDGAWYAPLINIGYFRDDWAVLEPDAEGKYRFDEYFGPIFDLWVKRWHKRVAFRFMSENMHSRRKYVTPKWVFDSGVPSVTLKGLYVPEQIDPVFWDEKYLAIQERFIADLGRYLDGRPGLEFIDIGSIGEWGEMHLARWTPELLQRTGFTETRYIAAYRRIIDAFARAFPHTRVFLNVGSYEAINDYAALRGLHFRQDGLTPSGPSADVGKRFYVPYSRRGVICNYELFSGYEEMKHKGWGVKETFAKGLEDPISYLHVNLMSYRELLTAPAEVKDAVMDAARRVGFRFVLTRLRCNKTVGVSDASNGRLLLEQTWRNDGVAPCYESYALRWSLVGADGKVAAQSLVFPAHPTTHWFPNEPVLLRDVVTVPSSVASGVYTLKVAMVQPERPDVRIQLGLSGRDADGAYAVCQVAVERRAHREVVVYSESFEAGDGGWRATDGMSAVVAADGHGGGRCLLVRGTQPGTAWNYAVVNLVGPVLPASRYRLTCWMNVQSLSAGADAPYLKIGLTDPHGEWLANVATSPYDTGRMGTWQLLTAYVETTPDTAGGHLAIEKGSLEGRSEVALRLDDVKLELLESP